MKMNRIVMIGDDGHGDPLYFKIVINSLNKWLSSQDNRSLQENLDGIPKKLFLILEEDSVRIHSLKKYFLNGDPVQLVEPGNLWGYQFTTSSLEFYYDLRIFWQRVHKFNSTHQQDSQVEFEIFGPEKRIDLSNWTTAQKDSFFIYERDEYSSAKIINILNQNPDAKALIYYGDGHFFREKVQKMQNPKSLGYFLAHYLTESFGKRGGVYTCNQLDVLQLRWLDPSILEIGKTFAVDNSIFNGVPINLNTSFGASRDGTIFEFAPARQPRHISTVLSENLVNYAIDSIDAYKDTSKEFYLYNLQAFYYYLTMFDVVDMPIKNHTQSGIDSTIHAWKQWRTSSRLNIVQDISSLNYFKRFVERIRTASEKLSTAYQRQLAPITGFKVWFQNNATPQVCADSIWSYIQRYRKPIIIENLINLLWIGSHDEIQEALIVLEKETGQSFTTAKEWTSWWESEKIK
jgi:hypothetical protein